MRLTTSAALRRLALPAAIVLFTLFGLPAGSALWAAGPDFRAILGEIDRMSNFENTDFSATYTVVSEKPDEDTSVFKVRMFRRDREDKFLMLFLEPQTQKGQGYLQLEDNLWFYDPESRKFSHSSFKENLQDSETKNSDFRRSSLVEDYEVASYTEETLGRYPVYVVDLKATNDEVSYPRTRLWIRTDNHLVLKAESYSLSDRLMRSAYYPNYIEVEGRFLPSRMLFVDELKPGEKSQVTIKDVSLSPLPDSVFTKAYLERVNR
jgi:outer membrane lipoprotein-sorting protein